MSVGRELADARRRLGLSLEDVAARTKIKVERLKAIEETDLWNLPAQVYLKGFLREYASTVQLEPEDVTARYLAELEDWAALTETQPFPEEAPSVADRELNLASNPDGTAQSFHRREPDIPPPPAPAPDPRDDGLAAWRQTRGVLFERAPEPHVRRVSRLNGRTVGRWLVPVIGLMALVTGYLVINPLVRESSTPELVATTDGSATDVGSEADRNRGSDAVEASAAPSAPSPAEPARDDSARAPDRTDSTKPPPLGSAPPRPEPSEVRPAEEMREPPTPARPPPSVPVPEPSPAARAPEPSSADAASVRGDVSGSWSLATRVEASDYQPFTNLNLGFRLQLRQIGDRVTGSGLKWMENGRPIPPRSRTPIVVEGVLKGDRLELQFTERGARRESSGTFVMTLEPDGTLNGRFESSAANSRGQVLARRGR